MLIPLTAVGSMHLRSYMAFLMACRCVYDMHSDMLIHKEQLNYAVKRGIVFG
jgi:hypothetical protein